MSHSEPAAPESRRLVDRWTRWVRTTIAALPAWPFFLGIVVSFAACAFAGRLVSERPLFENFVRFFSPIQPQRYFYPTASQLVAHIRHTVPPSKTLVLVGGASYFRGTGQNPSELWTVALQRQLGPRYAVVNFATDQADLTAFAAVAFQILAAEYPKILYVANGNLAHATPIDGGADYRYVFWDAYYKGLLPPSVADAPAVAALRRHHLRDRAAVETHLGAWLDQFAYACDLWTYLGYTRFFTVWTDAHREAPFAPRRFARESDDPNLAQSQAAVRVDPAYRAHSEAFAKKFSRTGFVQNSAGQWEPDAKHWTRFSEEITAMFPDHLRPKIMVVLLPANPFFLQTLTDEERRRTDQLYELSQQAYERAGYLVIAPPAAAFTADDFLDGGHLMASGGAKIARAVAAHFEDRERAREPVLPLFHPQAGPLEIAVVFPPNRAPRQETLFSVSSGGPATEIFSVEYLGAETVRLVHRAGINAPPTYSAPFSAPNFATVHTLHLSLSSLYPTTPPVPAGVLTTESLAALKSWLLVRLDERPFWEIPVAGRDFPRGEVMLGHVPGATRPVPPFSGQFYKADRHPVSRRSLRRDEISGGRVHLILSEAMAGRSFPLATTGRAGAGNVLFLRVNAAGNAVLGYDHWGTAPLLSPEIPLGFAAPHTIEFRLPALSSTAPPELTVTVNGEVVWQQRVPFFPAAADQIHFGKNPIGATSAEPTLLNGTVENVLVPTWRG